jgi:hypothetical protein
VTVFPSESAITFGGIPTEGWLETQMPYMVAITGSCMAGIAITLLDERTRFENFVRVNRRKTILGPGAKEQPIPVPGR